MPLVVLMLVFAGCGAVKSGSDTSRKESAPSTASSEQSAATTSVLGDAVFALYNKVSLEQTKDQVDEELNITGEENSAAPNIYTYLDSTTGYGVSVMYDNNKNAISKTLIYTSHKDIAPFCKKAVSKDTAALIKGGMTYDQVKALLGGDGIEICLSESEVGSQEKSVIRRWANNDGSCLDVYFGPDGTVSNSYFGENNY